MGDLERHYQDLSLDEGYLYAYGFISKHVRHLLHPKNSKGLSILEKKVLSTIEERKLLHPKELDTYVESKLVRHGWVGYAKESKQALESLHKRGLIRVALRKSGIRMYEPTNNDVDELSPQERLEKIVMIIIHILGPISQKSLCATITRYRKIGDTHTMVAKLISSGKLEKQLVDGEMNIYGAGNIGSRPIHQKISASVGTTRCRYSGATILSVGQT